MIQIINERTQQRSKTEIAKHRKTTQDLGGGENPNINVILDYKTPLLTIEWILLVLRVLITIYNPLYTWTPFELFKMREEAISPKPLIKP